MNFIINFLFRRLTVDSIVASFDKTIAKLETVQAHQSAKVDRENEKIERAYQKRERHDAEARRAVQTAERFKRLVRGDELKAENTVVGRVDVDAVRHGFGIDADSLQVSAP